MTRAFCPRGGSDALRSSRVVKGTALLAVCEYGSFDIYLYPEPTLSRLITPPAAAHASAGYEDPNQCPGWGLFISFVDLNWPIQW